MILFNEANLSSYIDWCKQLETFNQSCHSYFDQSEFVIFLERWEKKRKQRYFFLLKIWAQPRSLALSKSTFFADHVCSLSLSDRIVTFEKKRKNVIFWQKVKTNTVCFQYDNLKVVKNACTYCSFYLRTLQKFISNKYRHKLL